MTRQRDRNIQLFFTPDLLRRNYFRRSLLCKNFFSSKNWPEYCSETHTIIYSKNADKCLQFVIKIIPFADNALILRYVRRSCNSPTKKQQAGQKISISSKRDKNSFHYY